MRGGICMKLIVAVLRKEDEADHHCRVEQKAFVTELATTGGFLKEKNTTLLIGTDDHKLDAVLAILKQEAGLRKTVTYAAHPDGKRKLLPGGNYSVPIDTQTGRLYCVCAEHWNSWKNSKTLKIFKFRHMIPVVERQMRTLTVGIGTLFDGNCGENPFQSSSVKRRVRKWIP